MTTRKIGLLIGDEQDWPLAFMREINRRDEAVHAELVKLGGTRLADPFPYTVIVDRISHEIPYYRTVLKAALLAGTTVINNPLWNSAHDRFFNANLVARMGVPHPKVVALPSHGYNEGIVEESLRNLSYPIPWSSHIHYLGGFPVLLRPIRDSVLLRVYTLDTYEDLWRAYDRTGREPMMLQETLDWQKYVRCLCIGQDTIHPVPYNPNAPRGSRYRHDAHYLTPAEHQAVVALAVKINRALGYDVNAIELALKDGEIYAVDITNPVPDFEVTSLSPYLFDWVVKTMADYVLDLVHGRRRQIHDFSWHREVYGLAHGHGIDI